VGLETARIGQIHIPQDAFLYCCFLEICDINIQVVYKLFTIHQRPSKLFGGRALRPPDLLAGCKGWTPEKGKRREGEEGREGWREDEHPNF